MLERIVVFVGVAFLATGVTSGQCNGQSQYTNPKGEWSTKYDWFGYLLGEDCRIGGCGDTDPSPTLEIAHAALIPKGSYAGSVLVWREKQDVDPNCRCTPASTTYTWVWNPVAPQTMIRIDQPLNGDTMCAGQAWDPTGKLVVAGGGAGPVIDYAYKFRPNTLGIPQMDLNGNPIFVPGQNPIWIDAGRFETPRYYPTLITLPAVPTYGAGTCSPNPLPGGSTLALGGPPDITNEGLEYWELLPPGSTTWSCPILPEDPLGSDPNKPLEFNSPHYASAAIPPSPFDEYLRPQPVAERLLDTYPRAFFMSNKDIFVEGDVDTEAPPQPNDPGASWVIRPEYQGAGNWTLYKGTYTNGVGPSGSGSDPSFDRYYGSSVLLHEQGPNGLDRVIAFGGSYDANYYFSAGSPGGSPVWVVNDTVREYAKSGGSNPFAQGIWEEKLSDPAHLQRVWHNSVVLPTGEIFIVGGSSTDHEDHYLHPFLTPVFEPVIYDPGTLASDPGTVHCMSESSNQSSGAECTTEPIARLYHSVAVLLQDGRVFVAGGHWLGGCAPDSRLNGEVFSPPYLSESWRPVLTDALTAVSFGATFMIDVERQASHAIDRVVLLRPAAVTHHQDHDQRYIELAFSLTSTSGGPGGPTVETDTLTVTAPNDGLGPAGYYMLFAVESDGAVPAVRVPTVGAFLKLQ